MWCIHVHVHVQWLYIYSISVFLLQNHFVRFELNERHNLFSLICWLMVVVVNFQMKIIWIYIFVVVFHFLFFILFLVLISSVSSSQTYYIKPDSCLFIPWTHRLTMSARVGHSLYMQVCMCKCICVWVGVLCE